MVVEGFSAGQETAVLCSGGLDSAVLVAHEARDRVVQPIYVRVGFAWETAERAGLRRILEAPVFDGRVQPTVDIGVDMQDVYPASHWAIRGTPPGYDTPDEEVYLLGRNIVLLSKAGVYCAQRRITRIAMGPLAGNPFPDATPEFFGTMARSLSLGLAHPIDIATPFAHLGKAEVIRLGVQLGVPLELTMSCMNPRGASHCGQCSKCRERRDGFSAAGVADPTSYASGSVRSRGAKAD